VVVSIDGVQRVFPEADVNTCPFTEAELVELDLNGELLVYVPASMSMDDLAQLAGVRCNVAFGNEMLIRNVMTDVDQWFVTSASRMPDLLYRSGTAAARAFEDDGLHGMDLRRYLAFVAVYRERFGELPDQTYWTFLLSGRYDRSGVSIVGFDGNGVLSHHGWMRNFKAKFVGSRYAALPPRIEITPETEPLPRAYRGSNGSSGREAGMD